MILVRQQTWLYFLLQATHLLNSDDLFCHLAVNIRDILRLGFQLVSYVHDRRQESPTIISHSYYYTSEHTFVRLS